MLTNLMLPGSQLPRMAPSRLWGKAGMGAAGGRVANKPRCVPALANSSQAMRQVNESGSPHPSLPPAGEGVKPGAHKSHKSHKSRKSHISNNSAQRAQP
jgi:hypothetical protein